MRTIIVMPAYYAEHTLETTFKNLPPVFDEVVLCDDGSLDQTVEISRRLGITTITHDRNRGYGGNQKTLYAHALKKNPDIVIMVHPDNQYQTDRLPTMIDLIAQGNADIILGNRMPTARKHDMPAWKYAGNRLLTWCQNKTFRTNFAEFHTGLRAYSANLLSTVPFESFSDDFVFDSELLAWAFANHVRVAETPVECYYTNDTSSINFKRSVKYGLETLKTLKQFKQGYYHSTVAASADEQT